MRMHLEIAILSGCAGLSGTFVWRPHLRYTVSRIECRIKFPNQRCRAKIALHPPKSRCCTFLRNPSRQGAKTGGCRGGLAEATAALLGSENGSRYKGVSQLQSHQSRYSVQLKCWVFVADDVGFKGPKEPWQPETWQDSTPLSPPGHRAISLNFWAISLLNCTESLEKKEKITGGIF